MTRRRVIVVAHGHPDFSKGGAEIAAYTLFKALKADGRFECLFVAADARPMHLGTVFSQHRPDEILLHHATVAFTCGSQDLLGIGNEWREFITAWNPDVVHFHHYVNIGVELPRITKLAKPDCRVLMTLHEYIAICRHNGQMVKTQGMVLCDRSSPAECHRCYPDVPATEFALRTIYFKACFAAVDLFIAPSEFLRQRYIDWGLESHRIVQIENLVDIDPAAIAEPDTLLPPGEDQKLIIGYFGQINPYKGVAELLEAVRDLDDEVKSCIELRLHGANLSMQTAAFKERVETLIEECGKMVVNVGPYERSQLPHLLRSVHYVVVPSVWWENSPLVIQEAKVMGRPVMVRGIGGMKEKVGKSDLSYFSKEDFRACLRSALSAPFPPERSTDGGGASSGQSLLNHHCVSESVQ